MSDKKVKIDEVAETSSGGTPSRGNKSYYGGNIPWVKSGELPDGEITKVEEQITQQGLENSSTKLLETGTLLIAMYGATVGKLGILTFPAVTNQAVCAIHPGPSLDTNYLFYWLLNIRKYLVDSSFGGAQPNISQTVIRNLEIPLPSIKTQRQIASTLKTQLAEVEKAREAADIQVGEIQNLANAIIYESIRYDNTKRHKLGDVLREIKKGIGESWEDYPVLGATRNGLALAKEPPGKTPQRYKPVVPGTIFYNPMRILIGSIAIVDDDDPPGITSPDYVVLQGEEGLLDSRWFYYWLRSPLGEQCINSLARGAVRERMLFNRLAEGEIELPDFSIQKKASESLKELVSIKKVIKKQMDDIKVIPNKLLAQAFKME